MSQSTINTKEALEKYNKLCDEASNLNFITRDANLQKGMIKKLEDLKPILKFFKNELSRRPEIPDETVNLWFHFQCIVNAYIKSLNVWLNLKKNKNYPAWQNLVDANSYITYAIKVKNDHCTNIELFQTQLNQIESIIFPPLQFISPSLIVHGGVCSICDSTLETCLHIEKEIYRGQVCFRVSPNFTEFGDHVAWVEQPEDKACIVDQMEDSDGNIRDCITWKIIKSKQISHGNREGRIMLLREQDLDIF